MTNNNSLKNKKYFKIFQLVLFSLLLIILYYNSLRELISYSFSPGAHSLKIYSYISLVPLVSIYFLYRSRKKIFSPISNSLPIGSIVILTGLLFYYSGVHWKNVLILNDYLSIMTLSFVITLIGGFIFFLGTTAFRQALFPLGFLIFMTPYPALLLELFVVFLQKSSTEATHWLYIITGVPFERDGFVFSLSNLAIEVARECSGIRSSLILFMTSLVFGQLFLKTTAKKVILVFSVLPITIFKNALRIYMLSVLGNYVSAEILSSTIHRRGGIPFFVFSIILLALVVRVLQREKQQPSSAVDNNKVNE